MTLNEKLTIYEKVISALRKQQKMTEIMERLPIDHQVEAVRFMEFLEQNRDSNNGASQRKH